MKTAYFDTQVYNWIVDNESREVVSELARQIRERRLRIVGSLMNLADVLLTQDVDRRTKLLVVLKAVTHRQAFDDPQRIVKQEITSFIRSDYDPSAEPWSTVEWPNMLDRAIKGELLGKIKLATGREKAKDRKHRFLKSMTESRSNLRPLWSEVKGLQYADFSKRCFAHKGFLQGLIEDALCVKTEDTSVLADHFPMNRMGGVRCYLKHAVGLIYEHLVSAIPAKPKEGDDLDMLHAVYAGYCTTFVTGDKDFVGILSRFDEPQLRVFVTEDFFETAFARRRSPIVSLS